MVTCHEALAALERDDQAQLLVYTAEVVRLNPAHLWVHFVALAVWETRRRLAGMTEADNPAAYVRQVAMRMRRNDERLLLGTHAVRDETGKKIIGHVTVGSFYDQRGALVEPQKTDVATLGFVPLHGINVERVITHRERRVREHNAKPMVEAHDPDEREFQAAQRKGYSRREIPEYLGWDQRRANRVYMRLYRRRV